MPSWLKGGMIVSILYLIIGLILIKYPCDSSGYLGGQCLGLGVLFIFISSPSLGILNLLGIEYSKNPYLVIITTFFVYFIIGSILGWLYGKLKKSSGGNKKTKK